MLRVAIIDDFREARTLIRVVLTRVANSVVVAEAADIDEESLAGIWASHPDVVLIDRKLPSGDGASVVSLARELGTKAPKVVLYTFGDPSFPHRLLEDPDAYILLDADIRPLAEATTRVTGGTSHKFPHLSRRSSSSRWRGSRTDT